MFFLIKAMNVYGWKNKYYLVLSNIYIHTNTQIVLKPFGALKKASCSTPSWAQQWATEKSLFYCFSGCYLCSSKYYAYTAIFGYMNGILTSRSV